MVFRSGIFPSVLVSSIEHDSVLANVPDATRLPVTQDGVIDLAASEALLRAAPARSLVSVMLVNNETGIIQPIADIARLAKKFGHKVHTDAVQAAGRLPIDFSTLGVDYLTLSAHKIGGPQGVGALIVAEKLALSSMIKGGGQEMNRRAGTENVPGIIGFGVAARLAVDDLLETPRLARWRDDLQAKLLALAGDSETAIVIGSHQPRVANTLCIAMRGVSSETQVVAMDLSGVAVSAGAACSSGKVKASHVLKAMGYGDDTAASALRISLGWNTEAADIARCIEAWKTLLNRTRRKHQSAA
jgi:cysteine desulfurase